MFHTTPAETLKDERDAYELFYRCFGPSYFEAKQAFNTTRKFDSTMTRKNLFVIKNEKGDVIATARTVRRIILIHQEQFSVGGIATTAVHPDYRGKGLFTCLTDSVLEEMNRAGLDFAQVFARRAIDNIYTRHGFWGTPVERRLTLTSPPRVKDNPFIFRKIRASDIPFLTSVYRDEYSRHPVCLERPEYLWKTKLHNPALKLRLAGYICTYKGEKDPAGYAISEPGRGIIEACACSGEQEIYRSMFFSANSPFRKAAIEGIALPLDHTAMKDLQTESHSLFTRHPQNGGNVLRILNISDLSSRVMRVLKKELNKHNVTLPQKPENIPPYVWSRILTSALFGYRIAETEQALKINAESDWNNHKPVDFIFNALDDF